MLRTITKSEWLNRAKGPEGRAPARRRSIPQGSKRAEDEGAEAPSQSIRRAEIPQLSRLEDRLRTVDRVQLFARAVDVIADGGV